MEGGIIDDIILYKFSDNEFMLVVNAANRKKVYKWIKSYNVFNCKLFDQTSNFSLDCLSARTKIHL